MDNNKKKGLVILLLLLFGTVVAVFSISQNNDSQVSNKVEEKTVVNNKKTEEVKNNKEKTEEKKEKDKEVKKEEKTTIENEKTNNYIIGNFFSFNTQKNNIMKNEKDSKTVVIEEKNIENVGASVITSLPIAEIGKSSEKAPIVELPIAEIGKNPEKAPIVELPIEEIGKSPDKAPIVELPIIDVDKLDREQVIEFTDENLKSIILNKLKSYNGNNTEEFSLLDTNYRKDKDSNDILKGDLQLIEKLNLEFSEIENLSGLESSKNLKELVISFNKITDLTPISNISTLEVLKADYNRLENIDIISNLISLNVLDLSSNNLESISPVGKLTNLTTLIISNASTEDGNEVKRIQDVSSLKDLDKLEFLRLSHNDIVDISPVSNIKTLKYLYISHNLIENVESLGALTNLIELDVAKNKISKLNGLDSLVNLEKFTLTGGVGDHSNESNNISNISVVSNYPKLNWLWVGNNKISDVSSLSNLVELNNVNLENNLITDLSSLSNLVKMIELNISKNIVENIGFIENYTELRELNASGNLISNISPLRNLTKLNNLYINKNNIDSIDSLSKLVNLEIFDFSKNKVLDIDVVSNFINLYNLKFSENKVKDILKLNELLNLNELDISVNEISDLSVINDLTSVYDKKIDEQNISLIDKLTSENNIFEFKNPYNFNCLYEEIPVVESSVEGITVNYVESEDKFVIVVPKNYSGTEKTLELTINFGEDFYKISNVVLDFDPIVVNENNRDFYYDLFNEYSNFEKKYKNLTDEANERFSKTDKPLKSKDIRKSDMEMLKTFKVTKEDVDDVLVEPLKYAINLENFEVLLNSFDLKREVTDFLFLQNTKVKKFYYVNQDYRNDVEKVDVNLNGISNIETLKDVRVTFTNLENLEVFKNLKLINLSLEDNKISDISSIGNMSTLERLDLEKNNISNIESLKGLNNLITLYLYSNPITDITPLSNLTNLQALLLQKTNISNITPLVNLNNLHRLRIDGNNLTDDYFDVVKNLNGLNTIFLGNITKENFDWLKNFLIREEFESKFSEDKVRMGVFERLEIPLIVSETLIDNDTLVINNPLVDWDGYPIVQDENEDINENISFEGDKIVISNISQLKNGNNLTASYKVFIENYESVFGDYLQPASISGSIKLNIVIEEKKNAEVTFTRFDSSTVEQGQNSLNGRVFGKNLDSLKIYPKEIVNGVESETTDIKLEILNVKPKNADVKLTFLENTTTEDKTYRVYFGSDEVHTEYVDFIVKGKEKPKTEVTFVRFAKNVVEQGQNSLQGKVYGSELDTLKIYPKEVVGNVEKETTDVSLNILNVKASNATIDLTFLENTTTEDKTYRVYFGSDENHSVYEDFIVKGKEKNIIESEILAVDITESTIENIEDFVTVKVMGRKLTDDLKIFVKEVKNGTEIDSNNIVIHSINGKSGRKTLELKVVNAPALDTVYKVYYGFVTPTEFSTTITVKGKTVEPPVVVEKPEIMASTVSDDTIENIDDNAVVRIMGIRLTEDVRVFVKEIVDGNEVDSMDIYIDRVTGTKASNKTVFLKTRNIPQIDKKYKVYFGYEKASSVFETITIKGNGENTTVLEKLKFKKAYYTSDRKTLRLEFEENIFADSLLDLKSKIKFVDNGQKTSLSAEDMVAISKNSIVINLENAIAPFDILFKTIEVEENAVKSADGKLSEKVSSALSIDNNSVDIIKDYKIQNYVVESNGGNVIIEFTGDNLKETSANIRVLDVETKINMIDINSKIRYEKQGEKLIATIQFPTNNENIAKSYTLSIKNSKNQDISDKTEIITVVQNGKTVNDVVFSNIDIKSYKNNQSIGSGNLNVKHTEASEGQNSKKTWGTIYGANLDFRNISVIITDSKGITWNLISSTVDGVDKHFKYLGGNPTDTVSIKGSGTGVQYEILLPNYLDEDMTFTYQFVINGEIVEGAKATAFVKKTSANPSSTEIKTITVKYETVDGQKIAEEKILKGYSFLPYEISKIEIDGYEFVEVKDAERLNGEFGEDDKEIILIYREK